MHCLLPPSCCAIQPLLVSAVLFLLLLPQLLQVCLQASPAATGRNLRRPRTNMVPLTSFVTPPPADDMLHCLLVLPAAVNHPC
jgi:hypothetical protein